jgi:hypothetical protein
MPSDILTKNLHSCVRVTFPVQQSNIIKFTKDSAVQFYLVKPYFISVLLHPSLSQRRYHIHAKLQYNRLQRCVTRCESHLWARACITCRRTSVNTRDCCSGHQAWCEAMVYTSVIAHLLAGGCFTTSWGEGEIGLLLRRSIISLDQGAE